MQQFKKSMPLELQNKMACHILNELLAENLSSLFFSLVIDKNLPAQKILTGFKFLHKHLRDELIGNVKPYTDLASLIILVTKRFDQEVQAMYKEIDEIITLVRQMQSMLHNAEESLAKM
jgi:hypothetical protein